MPAPQPSNIPPASLRSDHPADYVDGVPASPVTGCRLRRNAQTHERYTEIVRRHLAPALGHHALTRLAPAHIQDHYSTALRSGRLDGKGGLAARTVLHHHRVLHDALGQAVRLQLLARNPTDATRPPRPATREMTALDAEAMRAFIEAIRETPMYCPVLLALGTGMRRGELLALRWVDVDLEGGTLAVVRAVEQTRAGVRYKGPKTAQGRRRIALMASTVEMLRALRAEQARQRLRLGPAYLAGDLVFAEADGSGVRPDRFTARYRAIAKKAGIPHVRFHDLRHTHATLMLREGVHPKIVSERLGHSKVGITLDTYSHVLPGMQEEAVGRLERSGVFASDATGPRAGETRR